jgi:hypothetical protein
MQGSPAAQCWAMRVGRDGCSGCMLSDGRFAVLGGISIGVYTSSCEALPLSDIMNTKFVPRATAGRASLSSLGGNGHWSPLPPMHDARAYFACVAVAGCIIVVGGGKYPRRRSAEVYDEVLGRWLRLAHELPHSCGPHSMRGTLL